jgi:hypothetical protein
VIFTPTEIMNFMRCRRRAWLTSKNGSHLAPIFSPLHLSTGTIVHRALQLWLVDGSQSLYEHAVAASSEEQDKVRASYKKAVGTYPSDSELLTLHEAIDAALTMCEMYMLKYSSPLPDDYRLFMPEQKIRVPIPGTPHHLEGKLDALIQHISTGRYDILEHKTYKNRPKLADLQYNFQFICYIWLVMQLNLTDQIPYIAYDGMWRRGSIPRGKTLDDMFARYVLVRTPHELQEFEKFLARQTNDMAMTYINPALHAYPNRRWEGCWDCSGISKICDAMTRGEDTSSLIETQFVARTDDNDEESDDTSDEAA